MHPPAVRTIRAPRSALALALAVTLTGAILGTACGGSDGGQAAPSTASTTPAKTTTAPAADAATAPAADPAAKSAVAATPPTASPAPAPAAAAVDEHAGHDHAKAPAEVTKTQPPPEQPAFASAAAAANPEKPGATTLAKAEALAAKKLGAPMGEEVDPNSKAKLTYEFGSETKAFGKCMQGDVLTHTFQLMSSGEDPLVIKQAKPTCGCTLAQVACQQADGSMAPYTFGEPIPSGRKVELTATLHTQNKRGHASSRINIFSNDPRGQSQLGLEADVDPFFQVNPQNLNFNQISARDSANDRVSITTTTGVKVKLTAPSENLPQGMRFEVTPINPDADGKSASWEIVAHLGPGLVEGNLAYTVGLRSDIEIPGGEKLPSGNLPTYEASVPIMARVTGMISYTPAFVSLGLIRPGQVISRSVRVTSHDPEFKLAEPKIVVAGRGATEWEYASRFSSVIRPVAGENAVDVELRLDGMPESLNGSFSGELVIQVGHPEKPEIKLPITGVCRGAPAEGATAEAPVGTVTPQAPPK